MRFVRFDPTNAYFKNPVGAVRENKPVTLRLCLDKVVAPSAVFLCVYKDGGEAREFPLQKENAEGEEVYSVEVALSHGLYFYYFRMEGVGYERYIGRAGTSAGLFYDNVASYQLSVFKSRRYAVPEWLNKGVMYQIFPDRFFGDGSTVATEDKILRAWGGQPMFREEDGSVKNRDFFGGNLKGIIAKLPYLRSLNVTTLYLNPVFAAYSNHKYDTEDYEKIDEMFGTTKDFETLCRKAKDCGISVVLDGVFNHVGSTSKYFNKGKKFGDGGAYNDENSPYRDWFRFDGDRYECWWNIPSLPRIRAESKGAQRYFCGEKGIVPLWIARGAAGWRLDVVDEIPDVMLDKIVRSAKKQRKDCAVIGEVWEDASNKISYGVRRRYLEGGQLDSVMNYPLRDAILRFVGTGDVRPLENTVFDLVNNYPPHVRNHLMNILGTHDTVRVLTALAGDVDKNTSKEVSAAYRLSEEKYAASVQKLKRCALLQYTFFGFPCVYYGDEAGMEGGRDPFCRGCYPWGKENKELLDFYRRLGQLRTLPVFCDGDFRQIYAAEGVYAFCRFDKTDKAVVVVHCGEGKRDLPLDGEYVDFWTGRRYVGGCTVLPGGYLVLIKQ